MECRSLSVSGAGDDGFSSTCSRSRASRGTSFVSHMRSARSASTRATSDERLRHRADPAHRAHARGGRAALGMSLDSFERHVQPELRLIRRGKLRLVPVAELERWADGAAERTLRTGDSVAATPEGITPRHARGCRHRETRCTCTPTFQAQVWDAAPASGSQDVPDDHRRAPLATGRLRRAARRHPDRRPRPDARGGRRRLARRRARRDRPQPLRRPATSRARSAATSSLRLRVLPELGHERLREITLPQLQRFVDRLAADGLAPATITPRSRRCARSTGAPASSARSTPTRPPGSPSRPSTAADAVRHRRAGRGDARAPRRAPTTARCGRPRSTPGCAAAS